MSIKNNPLIDDDKIKCHLVLLQIKEMSGELFTCREDNDYKRLKKRYAHSFPEFSQSITLRLIENGFVDYKGEIYKAWITNSGKDLLLSRELLGDLKIRKRATVEFIVKWISLILSVLALAVSIWAVNKE